MRKGEIACYKQFLLFSQCFLQVYIFSESKRNYCVVTGYQNVFLITHYELRLTYCTLKFQKEKVSVLLMPFTKPSKVLASLFESCLSFSSIYTHFNALKKKQCHLFLQCFPSAVVICSFFEFWTVSKLRNGLKTWEKEKNGSIEHLPLSDSVFCPFIEKFIHRTTFDVFLAWLFLEKTRALVSSLSCKN